MTKQTMINTKSAFTLSKKNIIRFLSVTLMISVYLPIVSENVPIIFSYLLNSTLFILSILILKPRLLIKKGLLAVYLYILIFVFLSFANHYTVDISLFNSWFQQNILNIFVAILMYTYYRETGDLKGLKITTYTAITFIFITAIITIIGNIVYPGATRSIYGGRVGFVDNYYQYYTGLGIGGYGFVSGIAILMPVLIFYIKNTKAAKRLKWVFILISFYSLTIVALIVGPILVATFGIVFSIITSKLGNGKLVFIVFLSMVIILLPVRFYANLFYRLAKLSNSKVIHDRLEAIGDTFETGLYPSSSGNIIENRVNRYNMNWKLIRNSNILIGVGNKVGPAFHLYFPSFLARFGLLGLLSLALVIFIQLEINSKNLPDPERFYYFMSFVLFIMLGMIKNIAGKEMYFYLLLIIPLILKIRSLKS